MQRKIIGAALAFASISSAFASNTAPMTYAQMVEFIGTVGESDSKISKGLIGKDVMLSLKRAGEKSYAVKASDMVLFLCDSAEVGYKGGHTKGKITKYESSPDGAMLFSLDRCAK